ncbi:hypothetical protein ACIBIZ_33960 [Nonomuraea spiralis]|uniref:hypothetical protein n=1 Tax=Nonomuraea TaxID=83681 RepID=UPI00163BFBC7|nr:hypothetical protein [Nonomuraea sp. WAC 01424]
MVFVQSHYGLCSAWFGAFVTNDKADIMPCAIPIAQRVADSRKQLGAYVPVIRPTAEF